MIIGSGAEINAIITEFVRATSELSQTCSASIGAIEKIQFMERDLKICRLDEPYYIAKRHVYESFYRGKPQFQPPIRTKPIMNRKRDFRFQPRSKCGI